MSWYFYTKDGPLSKYECQPMTGTPLLTNLNITDYVMFSFKRLTSVFQSLDIHRGFDTIEMGDFHIVYIFKSCILSTNDVENESKCQPFTLCSIRELSVLSGYN